MMIVLFSLYSTGKAKVGTIARDGQNGPGTETKNDWSRSCLTIAVKA